MKKYKKDYLKLLLAGISLIIIYFVSKLMLFGTGYGSSIANSILLSIFIILFSSSKKAFWFIIFPIGIIYSLYIPIGLIFGKPTYHYMASVLATDFLESKEFIGQIPLTNYLYSLLIILGLISFRFITSKYNIHLYRNKTILCLMIFFAMFNQSPFYFLKDVTKSTIAVKNEIIALNKLLKEDEWGSASLNENSTYDNYILIIGESGRKDYHHSYGYPINNTPFMSSSNGLLVDGLTSGGTNTISSLRLMLTLPDKDTWEPDYSLNFIDLANSADIETHWISNQGYFSEFDTPISAIAKRSHYKSFLKYGDFASKNTSDFLLLDILKNTINNHGNKKNLIVLHLYGSHPNACDRIEDYNKTIEASKPLYNYISCYVSSINKTDDFIRGVYSIMNDNYLTNKKSFSILYFSDHGLIHNKIGDTIYLNNSSASKLHFDIPLFLIASDSYSKRTCSSFKSGLNFTNGIANWIGISNAKLNPTYSLFDCHDDPDDYGLKDRINNISTVLDPAIDISK